MKIKDLNIVGIGLRTLGEMPMTGTMKFKIARNIKIVEDILQDAMASTDDIDSDNELLGMDVKVDFLKFTEHELAPLEIDSKTIYMILPLIVFEENA